MHSSFPELREGVRVLEPLHVGGRVVIAVQRTWLHAARGPGFAHVQGGAEVLALVVGGPGGWRALALDGTECSLADLVARVPELAAALADDGPP